MAKRMRLGKIIDTRYQYFKDVYKKYVYNIFTELNRPEKRKLFWEWKNIIKDLKYWKII